MIAFRGIVTSLVLAMSTTGAQGVGGTWRGEYDSGVSRRGDSTVVTRRSTAVLTLEQRGDSVFGQWAAEPAPPGAEPQRVKGKISGTTIRLTTGTNEVAVVVNGNRESRKVRLEWTGQVSRNELSGTMRIYAGDEDPPLRRWNATRVR